MSSAPSSRPRATSTSWPRPTTTLTPTRRCIRWQQEPYGYVGLLVDELILSPGRFLKLQISAFETLQKDDDQTLFAKPQCGNLQHLLHCGRSGG
ncbi:hypothetical protein DAI22_11g013366 [Oryza sativa Japonica Group]|nr:hypothetical protein DAI22_11g013366 [Oryza sativa Japonica Group]